MKKFVFAVALFAMWIAMADTTEAARPVRRLARAAVRVARVPVRAVFGVRAFAPRALAVRRVVAVRRVAVVGAYSYGVSAIGGYAGVRTLAVDSGCSCGSPAVLNAPLADSCGGGLAVRLRAIRGY